MDRTQYHNKRTIALLQASRFCGNASKLAKKINVSPSTLSKAISDPNRDLGLRTAFEIEKATGTDVCNLVPDIEPLEEYLQQKYASPRPLLRSISPDKVIILEDFLYLPLKTQEIILIDTEGALLSGLELFKAQRTKAQIKVAVIDLAALRPDSAPRIKQQFLYCERFSMGLRIEQSIGGNQGKRNDLPNTQSKKTVNIIQASLLPAWGEVKGRKDIHIAAALGFSTNTYYRLKQVFNEGILELKEAVDSQQLSIARGAEISTYSKANQVKELKKTGLFLPTTKEEN